MVERLEGRLEKLKNELLEIEREKERQHQQEQEGSIREQADLSNRLDTLYSQRKEITANLNSENLEKLGEPMAINSGLLKLISFVGIGGPAGYGAQYCMSFVTSRLGENPTLLNSITDIFIGSSIGLISGTIGAIAISQLYNARVEKRTEFVHKENNRRYFERRTIQNELSSIEKKIADYQNKRGALHG